MASGASMQNSENNHIIGAMFTIKSYFVIALGHETCRSGRKLL